MATCANIIRIKCGSKKKCYFYIKMSRALGNIPRTNVFIASQLSLKRDVSGNVWKYRPKIWVKFKHFGWLHKNPSFALKGAHFLQYVAVTQIPSNVFSYVCDFKFFFVLLRLLFHTRSWWSSAFHVCDMILYDLDKFKELIIAENLHALIGLSLGRISKDSQCLWNLQDQ